MFAKFIQQLLMVGEKENWLTVCTDCLQQAGVSFMKLVVRGGRAWGWNEAAVFTVEGKISLRTRLNVKIVHVNVETVHFVFLLEVKRWIRKSAWLFYDF